MTRKITRFWPIKKDKEKERQITMPRRTGPDKVADPRSSMLPSHTWNRGAFYSNGTFYSKKRKTVKETEKEMFCVDKEGLWSIGWVDWLVVTNSYQSVVAAQYKNYS